MELLIFLLVLAVIWGTFIYAIYAAPFWAIILFFIAASNNSNKRK